MPWYAQRTYKYLLYLLAGIIFLGALLDAIANASFLITPSITYWGTGLLFLMWLVLFLYIRKWGILWKLPDGTKTIVKSPNIQVHLFFVGLILTLWMPFFLKAEDPSEGYEIANMSSQMRYQFQPVFYPDDTASFNVLIIRFEDYIADKNTHCIGRSIQDHLSVVQANEKLPLLLSPH